MLVPALDVELELEELDTELAALLVESELVLPPPHAERLSRQARKAKFVVFMI
ncbi:hypothetical protein GCM10025770_11170 [Viridibacterium curvum]|uniref:Uncharacterized protein n=1 Tax=Viridibacterium curvum TaxID=1101404 RepID=A0ABP9QGT6_9RHOO